MTLETVYFVGQTISAVAVVVSLLTVAFQLHQGNKQTIVNTALAVAAAADRSFDPIYLGDGMMIWTRGLAGDPDMTEPEKAAFELFMARVMLNGTQISFAVKHGLWQKGDALRSVYMLYRQIADTPGGKAWCAANRGMLSDEFIELLEAAARSDQTDKLT